MKLKFISIFICFLISIWIFGQIPREEFGLSFLLYSLVFGLYILIYYWTDKINVSIGQILLMALLARMMFGGLPLHSDDYYRFYWDGQLLIHQINPYEYTPNELKEIGNLPHSLIPINTHLNSPDYHSIYPVTNQALFALAAWIGGDSIEKFVLSIRLILVFFEMIGIWILFKLLVSLQKNTSYTILYALNPLILLEITGNLHFEGMMVTFLFLGLLSLSKSNYSMSGGWGGTAISIKLTPLILLPMFLKKIGIRKFIYFSLPLILICGLFFLPIFLSGTFLKVLTSFQLYYGTFEFNASIYYVLRELGYLIKGYNMIASISMALSLSTFLLICYTAWKAHIKNINQLIFYSITAYFTYLLLSMVVHPWYIIPLVGLGIVGGMKFPLVWTYLIYLSYYSYGVDSVRESYLLLGVQYSLLVIFAISEYAHYLTSKKDRANLKYENSQVHDNV